LNLFFRFIDIGFTGYCVTVVDFIQENMRIRSSVCERSCGGRDFDDIIIEFLAESFQSKTGINVRNNKKAVLKLQAAAEKAKKTLSPAGVTEASISVECLAEDRDLNVILTKDEFEKRAAPLVNKLRVPIEQALAEAGLTKKDLAEIEIVGGTTRINIVKKTLGGILEVDPTALNYGLKTTMNADEAVARGCALQSAILSSRVKIKSFNIVDILPYGITAHFDAAMTHQDSNEDEEHVEKSTSSHTSYSLFQRGEQIPQKPKSITFRNKSADFRITLQYDDAAVQFLPPGESRFIARYTIRIPTEKRDVPNDIRVFFALDKSGLVFLQSAQMFEAMSAEQAAVEEGKAAEEANGPAKTKFRTTDLKIDAEEPGLSRDQIREALDLEASMAYEDRLIRETADKRNELESYIYSMRDRLDGNLNPFSASGERDQLKNLMNTAEDWLYNEGFDVSKGEYSRKIDELRIIGDKIEFRFNQNQSRQSSVDALRKQLEMCKSFAANYDDAHSHITDEERDRIRKEVMSTESWLFDLINRQDSMPLSADPVLTTEVVSNKRSALFNATNPIMIKPKPKPEPTPQPQEQKASQDDKAGDKKDASADSKQENNESTPMEEDTPADSK
jgi:heat shock 70kDa protein 4